MLQFLAFLLLLVFASSATKIPGCYIVSLNYNDVEKSSFPASLMKFKDNIKSQVGNFTAEYSLAFNGFTICGVISKSHLDLIRTNPLVDSIEQDQMVQTSALRSVNALSWGLDRIDQRSPALDGNYTFNDTAALVNVYVVDTGIFTDHNQFEGRAYAGYNFVDNNTNSDDCNGHGTHSAGIVGARDYGVCKYCRLIAVKVLSCSGSGTWATVISGINWVISHSQTTGIPSVMTMSLAGGLSSAVNNAVNNAVQAGIVVTVAAGNENSNACNYSPASTSSAITVGSITETGSKSFDSNFGSCVDIFAPGNAITSTWIGTSKNELSTISGTSMAAPHVAGVAAIYRSYNPLKNATEARNFLIDQISTLNVIINLDSMSPNRLLYSQIQNLKQTDRSVSPPPTLAPSDTIPVTYAPTPNIKGNLETPKPLFPFIQNYQLDSIVRDINGVSWLNTASIIILASGISFGVIVSLNAIRIEFGRNLRLLYLFITVLLEICLFVMFVPDKNDALLGFTFLYVSHSAICLIYGLGRSISIYRGIRKKNAEFGDRKWLSRVAVSFIITGHVLTFLFLSLRRNSSDYFNEIVGVVSQISLFIGLCCWIHFLNVLERSGASSKILRRMFWGALGVILQGVITVSLLLTIYYVVFSEFNTSIVESVNEILVKRTSSNAIFYSVVASIIILVLLLLGNHLCYVTILGYTIWDLSIPQKDEFSSSFGRLKAKKFLLTSF